MSRKRLLVASVYARGGTHGAHIRACDVAGHEHIQVAVFKPDANGADFFG